MFGNRILFNLFLEVSLISNKSEQLELKLELVKIIWIEKHAGKVRKRSLLSFSIAQTEKNSWKKISETNW